MSKSKIQWTQLTWNPLTGCDKVSAGCKNCYALKEAWRFSHNPKLKGKYEGTVEKTGGGDVRWTGGINLIHTALEYPLNIKKPATFFVNSMSDLFHENVPFEFVDKVFVIMKACPQHTFQILTKRPERMLEYLQREGLAEVIVNAARTMPKVSMGFYEDPVFGANNVLEKVLPLRNVILGTSAEDQENYNKRVVPMTEISAMGWKTMLSCEPLLGRIGLALECICSGVWDWVIAGGESGAKARPMHPVWVRSLRDQCVAAGVPFFFKQWGEFGIALEDGKYKEHQIAWVNVRTGAVSGAFGKFPEGTESDHWELMVKVGKKAAGRLLDGREWNEKPE